MRVGLSPDAVHLAVAFALAVILSAAKDLLVVLIPDLTFSLRLFCFLPCPLGGRSFSSDINVPRAALSFALPLSQQALLPPTHPRRVERAFPSRRRKRARPNPHFRHAGILTPASAPRRSRAAACLSRSARYLERPKMCGRLIGSGFGLSKECFFAPINLPRCRFSMRKCGGSIRSSKASSACS